jgi:hypothetical protein
VSHEKKKLCPEIGVEYTLSITGNKDIDENLLFQENMCLVPCRLCLVPYIAALMKNQIAAVEIVGRSDIYFPGFHFPEIV